MATQINNYFQAKIDVGFHFSVGAVLFNEKSEIAVHHFKNYRKLDDFYILMRATHIPNKTLEETLARGLLDEFGAKGKIRVCLGSLVSIDSWFGEIGNPTDVEKTTLYFLVELTEINKAKRDKDHRESNSNIEFHTCDFLIDQMDKQHEISKANDLHETEIIKRARKYII